MFDSAIEKKARESLVLLKKIPEINNFYLAGGTALSWQIGHRISIDLDFFIKEDFSPQYLLQTLEKNGVILTDISTNTFTLRGFHDKCEISFIKFPYILIDQLKINDGINIAQLKDIGLMKILAIADRGFRKDFIDLYFISKFHISLQELFDLFPIKYGINKFNTYHYIKSITFFENAEKPTDLKLLKSVNWKDVKEFMINESRSLISSFSDH